jgi:DNA-binding transcriptional MerR regulator
VPLTNPLQQILFDFPGATDTAVEDKPVVIAEPTPVAEKPKRGRKKNPPKPAKAPSKRGRKSFKDMEAESDLVQVPDDEQLFSKQYYSMHEVSTMFNCNQSMLRLWANEFDKFLEPKKNKKGDRFFRPEDVKTLQLIHYLIRQRKFTMEGARDFLKNNKKKGIQHFEMITSLQKIRAFLLELKANL